MYMEKENRNAKQGEENENREYELERKNIKHQNDCLVLVCFLSFFFTLSPEEYKVGIEIHYYYLKITANQEISDEYNHRQSRFFHKSFHLKLAIYSAGLIIE